MQLQDKGFSTIALRQGTVCGYSPRTRFDLIVNTMFKAAVLEGRIVVDNPSIWRPLIDVRDTAAAFIRAVQADHGISGVFNVAYDNFTVGQVSDLVKSAIEDLTGKKIRIAVHDKEDYRNYKVSCEKARTHLGFAPKYTVSHMVESLHRHLAEFGDFSDERFYNIKVFTRLQRTRM